MSAVKWILSIFLCFSFVFLAVFGINCVYGYLFPIKFEEEVSAASNESGVDETIIFSVINIESHFNKNAVSSKGAVGLMQVMPSTAQEMMKNLSENAKGYLENKNEVDLNELSQQKAQNDLALGGIDDVNFKNENANKNAKDVQKSGFFEENLKNPATNIMLGAKYLSYLFERFENLDTVLCAFNAGPNTVKNWLANEEYSSDAKTLSKIPYSETKTYIEKFHKNFKYYSAKTK